MTEAIEHDYKGIKFYGAIDRDKFGKVCSEYPAYMSEVHLENTQEQCNSMKRMLGRGQIPDDRLMGHKRDIEVLENKIKQIVESKPHLSDPEKNHLHELFKKLVGSITETLFTRSEMNIGLANPRTEMKRMIGPCVKVDAKFHDVLEGVGIQVDKDSMVSRNQATKVAKIIGFLLGEDFNIEALRKD